MMYTAEDARLKRAITITPGANAAAMKKAGRKPGVLEYDDGVSIQDGGVTGMGSAEGDPVDSEGPGGPGKPSSNAPGDAEGGPRPGGGEIGHVDATATEAPKKKKKSTRKGGAKKQKTAPQPSNAPAASLPGSEVPNNPAIDQPAHPALPAVSETAVSSGMERPADQGGVDWLQIPVSSPSGNVNADLAELFVESELAIQQRKAEEAEAEEAFFGGPRSTHDDDNDTSIELILPAGNEDIEDGVADGAEVAGGGADPGRENPRKRGPVGAGIEATDNAVEGRGKRARKGNFEVGDWVEPGKQYLLKGVDDPRWVALVEAWLRFEQTIPNPYGSRLGAANARPAELTRWLAARKLSNEPTVTDVQAYGKQWIRWWNALQPPGRKGARDTDLPLRLEGNEDGMQVLKRSGEWGLYIVMVGLKWWASEGECWQQAVQDVHNCLVHFLG